MAAGLYDFVVGGYEVMQEYADDAFEAALKFLDELGNQAVLLEIPLISYEWKPLPVIPNIRTATEPVAPNIVANFPGVPSDFIPGEIYPPNFDSAPEFNIPDPIINWPVAPPPLDIGDVPETPITDTDYIYPDSPLYVYPDTPTLESITIPTAPLLTYPTLTAEIPTEDIVTPGLTFNWVETDYTDEGLYDAIQAELLDTLINGGTGLHPDVEQAIWDRERNREDQVALKAKAETRTEWSKRGYSLPPGAELRALKEIAIETQNKIVGLGRDIAIKQADLEQENLRHAISETIRLEGILLDNWNRKLQRQFEAAKYVQDVAIALMNADISLYNTRISAYNIQVQAFNILMQAELAKLEAFKAEIDAQALINQINKTNVDIYTAQLGALKIQSDIYISEIDAINTKLQGEKLKIDLYLGELQGYIAQLDAKKVEYDLYKTQIDGEVSKTKLYDSQVSAFATRINAYATEVDAEAKTSDISIAHEDLRLRSYISRLDAYKTEVEAESTRITSEAQLFTSEVQSFSALTDAYSTEFKGSLDQFNAAVLENDTRAKLELATAESNITKLIETNRFLVETIKAGAMVSSEIASASLSAISLNAGMTASGAEATYHNYNYEV